MIPRTPRRPARSERPSSKLPAKLAACSAALLAGSVPAAIAGDGEGVVRATDKVTPTSAVSYDAAGACPTCPPGTSHGVPVGPGVPVPGLVLPALPCPGVPALPGAAAAKLSALRPDGVITFHEIAAGLRNKPALIPPLGHYDAYLPPDYGWQAPVGYPVQRVPVGYQRYYPSQWYGLPGSQKARVAPVAFMPTDTSQLGYYHQQVPTWQPLPPGSLPAPPDPRLLHARTCPAGPDVGVYPGAYPDEPRAGVIGLGDRLRDHHGPTGGTIVTDPVLGESCPVPQDPVEPLPTSTEPVIDDGIDSGIDSGIDERDRQRDRRPGPAAAVVRPAGGRPPAGPAGPLTPPRPGRDGSRDRPDHGSMR